MVINLSEITLNAEASVHTWENPESTNWWALYSVQQIMTETNVVLAHRKFKSVWTRLLEDSAKTIEESAWEFTANFLHGKCY